MPFKCLMYRQWYLEMINTKGGKERRSAESRVGETYGSLMITGIIRRDNGKAICTAKCENSGIEKEYVLNSLVSGASSSCGCLSSSSKKRSPESHIGETINNMTLLEVIGKNNAGRGMGRFKCGHCGSEHKEALIFSWKQNGLKSCGCKKPKKRSKPEDHIGLKYNHLTLIKITGKHGSHKTGLFHCSNCGKEKDGIKITRVTNGFIKSCGCLHNKAEDSIGTTWGNLKLLEITQIRNEKDIKKTKGIFECLLCGNHKELNVAPIKLGIQTDCGCSKFHGYTHHKSYGIYMGMIKRCTDPLSKDYLQYGGRGISVCKRWLEPNGDGLRNFMDDVGNDRPSKKYSLHRMWKYNEENRLVEMMEYSPENCAWATSRQQNIEQRSPKLKKRVAEFEKLLDKGFSVEQMATELKLSEQKVAFFLSIMGLLDNYKYQEGDDDV